MKSNNNKEVTFEIDHSFDYIIDEANNSYLALRKVSWNGREPKLELRKWFATENGEVCGKGCSFLTDNGPAELIYALIDCGYGETDAIINKLSSREDFGDSIKSFLGASITDEQLEMFTKSLAKSIDGADGYYDPRNDLFDEDEAI